jgi:hypothetical protein
MNKKAWLLAATLCFATGVQADEIKDAINEGLKLYEQGDMGGAAAQLDYASTLLRQAKGQALTAAFPEPLPGWQADEAESQGSGAMMFGGGTTASRTYNREDASVSINMTTDSPMLQSVLMMFSNPSIMAMSGGKLVKVQGEKAMLKKEGSLELTLVLDGKVLIVVQANGVGEDVLMAYANKINFAKIRSL